MPGLSPKSRARLWILVLAAALAAVAWDTLSRVEHATLAHSLTDHLVPPPAPDPASPTGYAHGQRRLILNDAGADGYHWIMQTQAMFATGEARIRHVDYDNAPAGREVHWASLFRWWLGALAWIDHAITGESIGICVERAALIASPLLLALALPAFGWIVARRFGSGAASLTIATLVGARACYAYFYAGNPDHHGIAILAAFASILGVVAAGAGVVSDGAGSAAASPCPLRAARRWFLFSAVAGGIGLWNSASTQISVLAGIGLGAVGTFLVLRSPPRGAVWRLAPELWRHWGIAGAVTSLVAYAIEYLPADASMRLEVNHPLHALAWLGAGEILCRLGRILAGGPDIARGRELRAAAAALALVAPVPIAVLVGGRDVFVAADKFYSLLSLGFTSEGQSVLFHLQSGTLTKAVIVMCLPALALLPLVVAAIGGTFDPPRRAQLVAALLPALLLLALGISGIRWLGIAVSVVPIAWMLGLQAGGPPWLRRASLAAGLTLAPGLWGLVAFQPEDFTRTEVFRIVERDVAQWLRRRTGADSFIAAAGPGRTSALIYYGGGRGLGTFYWENREGIEHAATLFRTADEAELRALIQSHGVTHLVLPSWDRFEQVVRQVDTRLGTTTAGAEPLVNRIARTKVMPPWLRLLPYPVPRHPRLEGESLLVFEVDLDAPAAGAPNRLAQYLLETGQVAIALRLKPALERQPVHFPALITLARIQQEAGRAADAGATLQRIAEEFPRQPQLSAEDHLRLAGVLARAREGATARSELERGMRALDERQLRKLTPAVLHEMLVLADALGVRFADSALETLARNLVPGSAAARKDSARP
jgi:hypothetical protein